MTASREEGLSAVATGVVPVPFWINGARVASRGVRLGAVMNPSTGEMIRSVPLAGAADVDVAVQSAAAAFPAWRDTTPLRRARVLTRFRELLEKHQKELAGLISEEHGKVFLDAMGSVQRGIEVVEFASGAPHLLKGAFSESVGRDVDSYSLLQPIGVCVGITPFNFPAMVPLWMFPVALACGNTFVLKPSEKDPSPAVRMGELLKEAGLPDGVFNVVHGDKEAVDALLHHPQVAAVSFVGSTPVARHIYAVAAAEGKRVQALGGAKNHAVVMPDADLPFAADAIIGAAYGSAGERCMAVSAVVAVADAGDALVRELAVRARALTVGPSLAEQVDMGPLVTREHLQKVGRYVDAGIADGAELVVDGRGVHVRGHENGFFLGPTLFDRVSAKMSIYTDEIFGPVLVVVRVSSLDEAIALVNDNPYGNGTALFTGSGAAARIFEHAIQVGMVGINVPIPVPMSFFSFGGWKQSLFGDLHVHGEEGVKFYTRTKAVTRRWTNAGAAGAFHMPSLG
ncbi:MAG: CoA-acylating methylmalonate-semialdehyde dehydrogenase [Luteitalea sp.]|nr:CoA-acylating methylmalonate-semialdehyde dehydrogenase [Luteitalea sp.]